MFDTGLKNAIQQLTNNTITIISEIDGNNRALSPTVLSSDDDSDTKSTTKDRIKKKLIKKFNKIKKVNIQFFKKSMYLLFLLEIILEKTQYRRQSKQ